MGAKSCWEVLKKRRGVVWKTVTLPVPMNDPDPIVHLVEAAITPRTRVIAWPHVTSQLGAIQPVREICALAASRGIYTVIDGAQAIGQIPIDVRAIGCDAYVGSPHKWPLAPAGNGFLYLRQGTSNRVWTTVASGEWGTRRIRAPGSRNAGPGTCRWSRGWTRPWTSPARRSRALVCTDPAAWRLSPLEASRPAGGGHLVVHPRRHARA